MKIIKTLPKDFCLDIISKHEDILTKEQVRVTEYFKNLKCVNCGNKEIDRIPFFKKEETKDGGTREVPVFDESSLLPKQIAKCLNCKCEFEPYTKLVIKL